MVGPGVKIQIKQYWLGPIAILWNSPLLLCFWFTWLQAMMCLGALSIAWGVSWLVIWRRVSLRERVFDVSGEVPNWPLSIIWGAVGFWVMGLWCFVFVWVEA